MTAAARPDAILRELHDLWIGLGNQSGEDAMHGVLRACALTLIVASGDAPERPDTGELLAELIRRHPCRAVVLRVLDADQPRLDVRVFAQCWLPLGRRKQICSEQIEITASAVSLESVAGLLVPLAVPDLPVVLWCRSPELFYSPEFHPLCRIAGKLIIDSAAFPDAQLVVAELAVLAAQGRLVSDLSWARITPWRELIAQVFETGVCGAFAGRISEVSVLYSGESPSSAALWLGAWLASSLQWPARDPRLHFERGGDGQGGVAGVRLAAPGLLVSLTCAGPAGVDVRVNDLTHRVSFGPLSEQDLLAEELSIPGRDAVFDRSLAVAAVMAPCLGG